MSDRVDLALNRLRSLHEREANPVRRRSLFGLLKWSAAAASSKSIDKDQLAILMEQQLSRYDEGRLANCLSVQMLYTAPYAANDCPLRSKILTRLREMGFSGARAPKLQPAGVTECESH